MSRNLIQIMKQEVTQRRGNTHACTVSDACAHTGITACHRADIAFRAVCLGGILGLAERHKRCECDVAETGQRAAVWRFL